MAPSPHTTFRCFSSLPPELRIQIWRLALPDKDPPALTPYKKGLWEPRYLSPSDEGYDERCFIDFEFRHDLLDSIPVSSRLALANQEARAVFISWACALGYQIHQSGPDGKYPAVTRPFDPTQDTLYITHHQFRDFCYEAYDRQFQPDLLNQNVGVVAHLKHIAIPESLLAGQDDSALDDVFLWYGQVDVILIVTRTQPDFGAESQRGGMRRWEVTSARGKAFVWNLRNRAFEWQGSDGIRDEELYRRIEGVRSGLSETLDINQARRFEMRPVSVESGDID